MNQNILLIVLLLPTLSLCDMHYFYYRNGKVDINGTAFPRTSGTIEFLRQSEGQVIITGSIPQPGEYGLYRLVLTFNEKTFRAGNDGYTVNASCAEMTYNFSRTVLVEGSIIISGTWTRMSFSGYCRSLRPTTTRLSLDLAGKGWGCRRFPPTEGGQMVQELVGMGNLSVGAVLGYAVSGVVWRSVDCWDYNDYKIVDKAQPGRLILGSQKDHCAVISKEGDRFVHVDPESGKVIVTPMKDIAKYFPDGYDVKDYSC